MDRPGAREGSREAAEAGIPTIHPKVYHNPDGYGRDSEFGFTKWRGRRVQKW